MKAVVLEKFRKSNRQLGDFMERIKQQIAKDKWSTLCDSSTKLSLEKKVMMMVYSFAVVHFMYCVLQQCILSEQLAKRNKHLSYPLLCYILQVAILYSICIQIWWYSKTHWWILFVYM